MMAVIKIISLLSIQQAAVLAEPSSGIQPISPPLKAKQSSIELTELLYLYSVSP